MGPKVVCIDPGWTYDERNAFIDPANPRDTPLGHHTVAEILPALAGSTSPWLAGIDRLADPSGLPRFVASRLTYRRIVRWLWWLLLPIGVSLLARLPDYWLYGVPGRLEPFSSRLLGVAITLLLEVIVVGIVLPLSTTGSGIRPAARCSARRRTGPTTAPERRPPDTCRRRRRPRHGPHPAARARAPRNRLLRQHGRVRRGRSRSGSRLGLPPVFLHLQQVSWIEIEAGAEVHARLLLARTYLRPGPCSSASPRDGCRTPAASRTSSPPFPAGSTGRRSPTRSAASAAYAGSPQPARGPGPGRPRLGRRAAGAAWPAASAVRLHPARRVRDRRRPRRPCGRRPARARPRDPPRPAARLGRLDAAARRHRRAPSGAARRGRAVGRRPGADGDAVVPRTSFRARFDLPSLRTGLATLLGGVLAVTVIGATVIWSGRRRALARSPDLLDGAVGRRRPARRHRHGGSEPASGAFLDPALLAIGLGLASVALVLAFRPVVDRRRSVGRGDTAERAADVVRRRGTGTLDYFALRTDKQWFFDRDGLVAYAIYGGICLVSPDPICAPEERDALVRVPPFRRRARLVGRRPRRRRGVAPRLPPSGMRDLYIGDEASSTSATFSLDGGTRQGPAPGRQPHRQVRLHDLVPRPGADRTRRSRRRCAP